MTNDLISRLRDHERSELGIGMEAADEIQRLRAAITIERARVRSVLQACQHHLACNAITEDMQALYQRVRAEVERD